MNTNTEPQAASSAALPRLNIRCDCSDGTVHGSTNLNVVRVEQEDDGSFTAVTDHWPSDQPTSPALLDALREAYALLCLISNEHGSLMGRTACDTTECRRKLKASIDRITK